ncbi:calcium/sodium antiporter [Prevotella merdae]|uniref:calcium/sodium antiporter n=1 Tax=Prevotella merdae TaxID=2079531 RepID=UPI003565947A
MTKSGTGSILINIVLLVMGLVVVLKGADWLTDGAVNIASRFGVSQMVIGLTIVAMGTSMPELCVSMVSALKGTPDLAVGNVVGSNTLNTLLIVGCSALVAPIMVKRSSVRRDIPFAVLASLLMLIFCLDGGIDRLDATLLFILFAVFMFVTVKYGKNEGTEAKTTAAPLGKATLLLVVGLVCLILGSNLFVDNASFIASTLSVSDAVIGLTIVAGGTSLPELATSMVSGKKGNSDIAIGNVIGSNVFNILMIIGVTGLVKPMHIKGITSLDLIVMLASILLLWFFCRTTYKVKRWEGAVLAISYIAYLAWLIAQAV